ncbi:ribonucleoside triphosphate reductase [Garciella nitratireducens]|uniref:Ribonucleoside-triphosphate reductase class III catalytic subunit n=1 Tax=Garciella nitratireducens DSM 15102 TaxID=1121911 RepID=A0A1T4NGV7_9FIRM|nr:ribonucleoside triphosphate reductase [Garciella nitratireducens]RBP42858.1 ribonucleoside-triphosphate reductase class III catalytic subunit [Garciella nitratireducens]SJZ78591.1 ribonucleoside-triphosphate reductase class III catalytic subunit [Garciella nitratireducens DSM 15102]
MITKIQKRNGAIVDFDVKKIEKAIFTAAKSIGGENLETAKKLSKMVSNIVTELYQGSIPTVEDVQDIVEKVLIEEGHAKTAKAYILYRKKHEELREIKNLFMDAETLIDEYISLEDWRIHENANMGFSLQGLNNHIVESITKKYWLNKIYRKELREAHMQGDLHIHDLGLLAPYCCGWDLEALLLHGFKGASGKIESSPASHLQSFLGQIVNWLYTLQGEAAGAQAISSLDTYVAPFIYYDKLNYDEVKRAVKNFVFNLNIPTRVGFQTPFSNITLDITPHPLLKNMQVIIGGERKEKTYGEFQKEMDLFNKAFCEVMMEGDGANRNFSFPIPTINITKDFPWDSEVVNSIMKMTGKFGIPYFANFVSSDLSPEDIRSMCCRLRLDNRELRRRGGGLFGANPLTGSINVVTLNMSRIGYLSKSVEEFKRRVRKLMEMAKEICETKRKILERYMEAGLYPYSKFYLQPVKDAHGQYFKNHFSTIGLNGMNEACVNLLGKDITTEKGKNFAIEIMEFMNRIIQIFQEETGNLWNLEASPAEGATYRFARMDKKMYPKIFTQGTEEPYYTNSTQLPVNHTKDIFEAIEHQDKLQTLYTGGTVFHGFLGEEVDNIETIKLLLKRAFENSKIPYLTITPTYSICPDHGYLKGEQFICPECGKDTEVWTRVVGFHRPIQSWNKGKKEEYKDRLSFDTKVSFHKNIEQAI